MNNTQTQNDPDKTIAEFQTGLSEIQKGLDSQNKDVTDLKSALKSVQDENAKLAAELDNVRRQWLALGTSTPHVRRPGFVSDHCARHLAAVFILGNARSGRLDRLDARVRESLFTEARSVLGLETKAALTTTDIPLPSLFSGEFRELIAEFGVARRNMFPFPTCASTFPATAQTPSLPPTPRPSAPAPGTF